MFLENQTKQVEQMRASQENMFRSVTNMFQMAMQHQQVRAHKYQHFNVSQSVFEMEGVLQVLHTPKTGKLANVFFDFSADDGLPATDGLPAAAA